MALRTADRVGPNTACLTPETSQPSVGPDASHGRAERRCDHLEVFGEPCVQLVRAGKRRQRGVLERLIERQEVVQDPGRRRRVRRPGA
jgi:hypothetical protein